LKKKSEEAFRKLSPKTTETFAQIQNFIKHPGDIVNKAKLFEVGVLKKGVQLGSKIVSVLVDYGEKMEMALLEMRAMMTNLDPKSETMKGSDRLAEVKATPFKTISFSSSPASEKKVKGILKTPQSTKPGSRLDSGTRKEFAPESQTKSHS